tara:strand:+ start:4597 stop:5586 length:990 start_codon:yes stop_codon:yes gene_type:complete
MENSKKILICGLGSIGSYYVNLILKKWPSFRISILRSGFGRPKKEELLVENVFTENNKAIKWKPDFCIVASPAPFHLSQALFFGREGIPLLIEKPIGIPFQENCLWQELILISTKVPIYVGYVLRHYSCAKILKMYLTSNLIGEVLESDFYSGSWLPLWRPNIDYKKSVSARKELGGGVLLELSHEIDLALYFFNNLKINYSFITNTNTLDIDVEDQAFLKGFNNKNTLINIRLNFCSKIEKRYLFIRGTKGEINWDIKRGELYFELTNGKKERKIYCESKEDIFQYQLARFFEASYQPNELLCNVKQGISVLRIIEQAININKRNSSF